jgi:hypothetical protein
VNKTRGKNLAASSEVAARREGRTMEETREERTKSLEKYRWKKGQSGNP